ncbi:WD repeat-containing protein 33 [Binucleata daphniae]
MDNSRENNQKQHQNFVYDGKRMRSFIARQYYDYSSATIHSQFSKTDKNRHISTYVTPELAHVSVNKTKCTVNTIKWTPDGRRLIAGTSTGELTLWNAFSFSFETILQAHESPVKCMCWSPTGSFLVSGCTIGIIKYWHPSMSNIQCIQGHNESIRDISFAPFDSKFCTCSDDGLVKIWDSKEAKEETVLKGHGWDVRSAKWHPYKAIIASGGKDNCIKLWDPRVGGEIKTLHIHKNTVFATKWSICGNYLYSGSKDQTVKMTDIRNMKPFTYKTNGMDVSGLGVHPHCNDLFVSACANGALIYYKQFDEEPLHVVNDAHDNIIWSAEYHPMGHVLATGSLDQTVRFWIGKKTGTVTQNIEDIEEPENNADFIPGL